jgi:putative FmdB family regulatory protein
MLPTDPAPGYAYRRGYHRPVPIYEFRCGACGERFEALVDAGTEAAGCRACGAEGARRVLSAQAAPFGLVKPAGAKRRQERRNAELRTRTKADFAARRRRDSRGGA